MTAPVRRVITTHDAAGKSVFHADELVSLPDIPGLLAAQSSLWVTSGWPADNQDLEGGSRDVGPALDNGAVFRVVDMKPGFVSPMHRTHTIDYGFVLSGQVELELDGAPGVVLKAGDFIVQRGTNHVWRNSTSETSRLVFVMMEAKPVLIDGKSLDDSFAIRPIV